MKNKILLPIVSAILASTLVITLPVQAEENLTLTTASEVYQEEFISLVLEESIIEEVYENQAVVDNEEATEENVITPDSFLYSFKVFLEEIKLFFTFDNEKKSELLVQLANERLLEADLVAEKGNLDLVKELIMAYEEKIAALDEIIKEDESVIEDTYNSIIDQTYGKPNDGVGSDEDSEINSVVYNYKLKNIAALTMVCNKVPDHVKPIIQRNLQRAIEKREAHIAKNVLKKKAAKVTTGDSIEIISKGEPTEIMDQPVEEVKVTIRTTVENPTDNKIEEMDKVIKTKDTKKKDTKHDDIESDESEQSKDVNKQEEKDQGKGKRQNKYR